MTQEEIQAMQTAFTQFKEANDAYTAEVKKFGNASADSAAKVEKLQGVLDTLETKINARMDAEEAGKQFKALLTRIDELEAKLSRKGVFNNGDADDAKAQLKVKKEAFLQALRWTPFGQKSIEDTLGPERYKALVLSSDTQGGYLAPVEMVNEMLMNVIEYSAIRTICRQRPTTRNSIQFPKKTQNATATWVEETGTRVETQNPAWGMLEIPTHEMYAMAKVSKIELEDAAFNLESFLNDEFSEQFGVAEATAFVSGNGVGKPEGLLTASGISTVNSGDASLLLADSLIACYYDVKEVYTANSTWVMARTTLKTIRQMKTTATGEYVWTPGIKSDARPATILDRPYLTAPEMPAIAANAYPVLFGDFKRGYLIVDRLAMEMMNDPYTSKSTGMVEFSARRRVGGKVILAEALRKIKIATA